MKLYIPNNLDIYALTHNTRPTFKPYKLDKLCYILHLINAIPALNKELMFEEYTPINAQQLQKKIQNYKQYLNYLEKDLKIIESDNHYLPGEKSKGFRFIEKYQTEVTSWSINDFSLKKTLKVSKNKKVLSVKHLDYLTKWFNPNLEIDLKVVNDFLEEEYNIRKDRKDLWDYDRIKKRYKKPLVQKNHAFLSAQKLNLKDYNLVLDDNVYRVHSNLTNMRSIIRNAVTYNGEKLISIDIKNSQPYLSTILLSRSFWIEQKKMRTNAKNELTISFSEPQSVINGFSLINNNKIDTTKTININKLQIHKRDSYIMLGEVAEHLINKEFQHYINLVVNGGLYEYLETQFLIKLGIELKNRKDVKVAVFQVLFTDNRYIGQDEAKPKKLFQQLFPEVYEVFAKIKKKDKSLLPRLLQSIESYLIIDVIAKRIAIEFPNAPIFTIHDSIASTAQYINDVKRITEEELTKAIGHAPKLHVENWDTKYMYQHLDKLRKEASNVA